MVSLRKVGPLLALKFEYNPEYVAAVKTIPGRRWDDKERVWFVPVEQIRTVLDMFPVHRVEGFITEMEPSEEEKHERLDYLRNLKPICDYEFVTKPRPHQIEGFNVLLSERRVLLGDDMGLGKTKQVLDAFGALRDYMPEPFLVIVGSNGTKYNWLEEARIHSRLHTIVIDGTKVKRVKLIRGGSYDIAVINAESLRVKEIRDALAEVPWAAIAVDECHKAGLKNPLSQVGRAIHSLHAEWQFAMTGTPIMNRPDEAYNMLRWLGYERRNVWAFRRTLCIYGGYENRQVVGYRAEAVRELQSKLGKAMLRRRKTEVLDLPPKTSQVRWVELGQAQRRLYGLVEKQTLEEMDNPRLRVTNPLTKTLRLRQILSMPEILESGVEGAKMEALESLLEEITESGQKALVFSSWTEVTSRLREYLRQYSPAYITGEVKAKEQAQEVERFQTDPNCKVAIGTLGAMGASWTMTAASYVIFVDWDWSPKNNEQAEDRAWRDGTRTPVTVIYLAAKGTVDEGMLEMLKDKNGIADMLVDGSLSGEKAADLVRQMLRRVA